jgi:hypothetical protein
MGFDHRFGQYPVFVGAAPCGFPMIRVSTGAYPYRMAETMINVLFCVFEQYILNVLWPPIEFAKFFWAGLKRHSPGDVVRNRGSNL